jgi:hypothetical protein
MGVSEILEQVRLIQDVMRKVMVENEHYGCIPGCGDKKTLLQPGAQKLTMTFRLCPEYEIQEVNIERGHKEYRVICTLKSMGSGSFVGQGVGCCSTMESKYRWRGGTRKCPKCGKEAIIMGKKFKPTDPEPGWLCWKKKEGCGATWPVGAREIEGQSIEKVENDNPADCYNTVLKMAKKRAFVDATITATAASDIFTQDIGDDESDVHPGEPMPAPAPAPRPAAPAAPPARPAAPISAPAPAAPKPATAEHRAKMIENLKAGPGQPNRQIVTEYFEKIAQLLPGETLESLDLRFVPRTKDEMLALSDKLAGFGQGEQAARAFTPGDIEAPAPTPNSSTSPTRVGMVQTKNAGATSESCVPHPRGDNADDEWWREIVVVVPRKGMKRDEYLRAPDTIGSLFEARHGEDDASHEARRRLFGFVSGYEPKGWIKHDGTQMPPNKSDVEFREALDAFKDWFDHNHAGEKI